MLLAPKSPEEMAAAHRAASRKARSPAGPKLMNRQAVLDLGNTTYFTFRGRAYGVPPLPWKAGQQFMALWVEALQFPSPLTQATRPAYQALLAQLPSLLWRHCRPVGWIRRALRRLRIHPNPFQQATEKELVDLAGFFLKRRMTSTIQPLPHRPAGIPLT